MDLVPIKPVADATKAVAETTGKALDMVSAVGKFSNRLIGDALAQGGGMVSDQVQYWRRLRLVTLEAKFNAACEARGLDPDTLKPLSLGQTVQVLEAASLEESDEVQDLWAELLANAVDPDSGVTMKKMYVTLLRDLGPAEAALLEVIGKFRDYEKILFTPARADNATTLIKDVEAQMNEIADRRWRKFPHAERHAAINNLRRLGCVVSHIRSLPYLNGVLTPVQVGGSSRHIVTVDAHKFERLLLWLVEAIRSAGGAASSGDLSEPTAMDFRIGRRMNVPELRLELTPIGLELVTACSGPKPGAA